MKKCNRCSMSKNLSEFHKQNRAKDKVQSLCKLCKKQYQDENKESIKLYKAIHAESISISAKAWREKNRLSISAYQRLYKAKNRAKLSFLERKRQAIKHKSMPNWISKNHLQIMEGFYVAAKELARLAGCQLEVDHIIPLLGRDVCGLHVPWNLQLLTKEENLRKGNRLNVVKPPQQAR